MTKVGKALNTCNCKIMIDPARVGADHDVFLCGDDAGAKDTVKGLAAGFRCGKRSSISAISPRPELATRKRSAGSTGARRIREAACLDNGHHSVAKRLPNFVLSEDDGLRYL